MKKRCFLLACCLLLFTSALAEFDLTPYTYKTNPVSLDANGLPLSRNQVLITEYGRDTDTFLFYEGQTLLKSVQLPADSHFRQPFVLPDGRAGFFLCNSRLPRRIQAVQFFDSQGEPEESFSLSAFLNSTVFIDNQWISMQKIDNLLYLYIRGTQEYFPFGQTDAQPERLACTLLRDGNLLAAVCLSKSGAPSPILLKKISPNGCLIWAQSLPAPALSGLYVQLIETPEDSIIVSCVSKQHTARLCGLNAAGEQLWQKDLSCPDSQIYLTCGQPAPEGARFYGYRLKDGIYEALSLEISSSGQLSHCEARDLSALPQTDALSVRLTPDGCAVVSSAYHEYAGPVSHVFVPFDVLPKTDAPALTLQ